MQHKLIKTGLDCIVSKIVSYFLGLFAFLSVYATGIDSLTWADAILVLFLVSSPLYGNKKIVSRYGYSLLGLAVSVFLPLLFGDSASWISSLRFTSYILFLLVYLEAIDLKFLFKIYRFMIIVSTAVVVIQFISFEASGVIVLKKILPLPLIDLSFEIDGLYADLYYRPHGIFLEPTHHAQLASIVFFYDRRLNNFWAVFILVGIALSGSSAGLAFIILILGFHGIKAVRNIRVSHLLIGLGLLVSFFFAIDFFASTYDRVMGEGFFSGEAFGYRFDGIITSFSSFGFLDWFIGIGRGAQDGYLSSLFYIVNSGGFIALFFLLRLLRVKTLFETIFVVFMILGSELLTNYGLLIFLPLVYKRYEYSYNKLLLGAR
jgi:hypothetical protein